LSVGFIEAGGLVSHHLLHHALLTDGLTDRAETFAKGTRQLALLCQHRQRDALPQFLRYAGLVGATATWVEKAGPEQVAEI
jgi:hypothetical protein